MDPVTQGAFGALWAGLGGEIMRAMTRSQQPSRRVALGLGALAGMAADLDVLISSPDDPLLALEFHRHFTHSFLFIPVGALICAAVFWCFARRSQFANFKQLYLICLCGYASHGLLDAFTSYGTQLLWPFSNYRVAWDMISIVDPLFTIPLIGFLLWARPRALRWGFAYVILYLGVGLVQRERAIAATYALAQTRGHQPLRVQAKPSFGNLVVFRGVYEHAGRYYADAIRVGMGPQGIKYYPGGSLEKRTLKDFALIKDSVLFRDIGRFAWFSGDFLAQDPRDPQVLGDFRYSMLPNTIDPIWGIRANTERASEHAPFVTMRALGDRAFGSLWKMISGQSL